MRPVQSSSLTAYKVGCQQLADWHELCRRKRLGIAEAEAKVAKMEREARRLEKNERDRIRRRVMREKAKGIA